MASTNSATSAVRQPRGLVRLNSVTVKGWIDWTVTSNSYYQADTFRVTYAMSLLPKDRDLRWFSSQKELFVEVLAGFPTDSPDDADPSSMTTLIYGRVDDLDVNPVQRTITLTGRDLTAVFIDGKVSTQYLNKTSSEIVQAIVAKYPTMGAVVTPTKTLAGTYYRQEQTVIQANESEWELMTYLARHEGFLLYVFGHQVYFEPPPEDESQPYDIAWQPPSETRGYPIAPVSALNFSRNLTVAKGISVTVRSSNLSKGRATVQSYPSKSEGIRPGKSSPFGDVISYVYNIGANYTAEQVQAYAKARYDAIVSHEMKMTARLPADNTMSTKRPIRISGTDSEFDQIYFPRSITREMSLDQGYEMTIEAQNVSADTQPEE